MKAEMMMSSIHRAIEFEDRFGSYLKPKDGSRCFQIKHPVIQKIVREFYELNDEMGFTGIVHPEALITDVENNHCALSDRFLVTNLEKKECRVQDYKVNIGFDKKGEFKYVKAIFKISLFCFLPDKTVPSYKYH